MALCPNRKQCASSYLLHCFADGSNWIVVFQQMVRGRGNGEEAEEEEGTEAHFEVRL